MASNYTSNYGLCQWAASDKVLRTEFNADNAKIDAALAAKASASTVDALAAKVDTKADKSALDSLTTTVNGKADKSTVTSLSSTVKSHGTALSKKGNCTIYTVTYTGNGRTFKSVTFPGQPLLAFFSDLSNGSMVTVVWGMDVVHCYQGSSSYALNAICSGDVITLSSTVAESAMNGNNRNYKVVAFIPAGA